MLCEQSERNDSGVGGNEDRGRKRGNRTERERGEEREELKERDRFCFFAPLIPDEIDSHTSRDLPLSPFSLLRPASITYLSRG